MPEIELVGEFADDILSTARQTKDANEIEQMRRVGRKTCEVVQSVVDYISASRASDGVVVTSTGTPITIGAIKQLISREVSLHGMEAPIGVIFSQGRDTALPHAEGDDPEPLRLGEALTIDIFPREVNGYYHDMTRTFAIGYASPELQQTYDQVKEVLERVVANLKVGERVKTAQDLVCDFFEQRNHQTVRSSDSLEEGYIHELGHGVGLDVHEQPLVSGRPERKERFEPGAVFTLEPGLYYPSKGFGVRLEDVYYLTPEGDVENLTPFPKELVIPVRQ
jgi:Xaa-Pro aminopeptidase